MASKISVLIINHSAQGREKLAKFLNDEKSIKVIAEASTATDAELIVKEKKPNIILLDNGPKIDALKLTRRIVAFNPIPILIVDSSQDLPKNKKNNFDLIEAGALEIAKLPEKKSEEKELMAKIRIVSGIMVVTRISDQRALTKFGSHEESDHLVVIAASTGGPVAIRKILSHLEPNLNAGIVIVQHISEYFVSGFISWLSEESKVEVKLAQHGDFIKNSKAYVCPAEHHLKVVPNGKIKITNEPKVNGARPSADVCFSSAAESYGTRVIGVILTGMGKDGTKGMLQIKKYGGMTVAQDESTSVVFGMPKNAIEMEAAKIILPIDEIALLLNRHMGYKDGKANSSSNTS